LSNQRIRDLAKELGVESKSIIDYLAKKGNGDKTSASNIDDAQAEEVRRALKGGAAAKKAASSSANGAAGSQETEKPASDSVSGAEKKDAQAKTEKPKKKKFVMVFHPQNASSKEVRNFRPGGAQQGRGKAAAPHKDTRSERAEENRGGRPVGKAGNANTVKGPLVHRPRPHGVIRNENPKPPVSNVPERRTVSAETRAAEEAEASRQAEAAKAAEVKAAETSAAAEASAAEAAEKRAAEAAASSRAADAAAPQQDTSAVRDAAQTENTHAAEASAVNASAQDNEKNSRNVQVSRPKETSGASAQTGVSAEHAAPQENAQERHTEGGSEEHRPFRSDRNSGSYRGDRTSQQGRYGDRTNSRGTGDRAHAQSGDRTTGGRYSSQDRGTRRPFGDRNSRPGQGQGRTSSFGQSGQNRRPGGFGAGRSDNGAGSRFGAHTGGRPGMHSDRHVGGAAMDVSVKKPTRDSRSRDKDKNKEDLRGNKFTNDSRRSGGHNNRQLIPKALQKPSHKKDEKKEEKVTEIKIGDKLTIRELAEKMKINPSVVVKDLFMKGEMYTVNQEVDYDKAEEIAMNYDISCEHEEAVDVIAEMLKEDEEDESKMIPRPPVVCVMGHVDHGKTSLLDKIRHSHVTEREAGGITQNIGAYCVRINGRMITFLDTPGHEAFTAMRMRGANSTDIAVLVVAADDGVMPQTVEAINHAKAANVEIIVAINKIDKPGANPDRVKQELTEYGLVASDWGGQTEMVEVSAKTGQGIDDLLDTILLTADILELKANPDRLARGLVLEAKLDKGKGPVANLLVQKGTLHVGDYIACGSASGKVRGMTDENGKSVRSAGPSIPVEVQGLNGVPDAGEILLATETDKEAKNIAATYVNEHKNALLEETKSRMSLDALFDQIKDGSVKELELIVKADVQGSVEALKQSLEKLSNDEVVIKIIHGGVGAINESDVSLAAASNAIVIGFNVRPDQTAKALADEEKVDIRLYRVIYQAIDDITAAMNGMLEPVYEEKVIGHAEVRQLFKASGVGNIAGSYVLDGSIQRGCKVRVYRGDDQLFEGELGSLKRFKDDVREVKAGFECGIVVEGFDGFAQGDRIEAYIMAEVPR